MTARQGRPQHPIRAGSAPLQEFAERLRALRVAADNPTYREMSRRSGLSISTLSHAARGDTLPTLNVTLRYVCACGGEEAEWIRRWHQTRAAARRPAASPAPGARQPPPAVPPSVSGAAAAVASRSGDAATLWSLPWPPNPNFVGRNRELTLLRRRLLAGSGPQWPQALHGLGGVGKTQLAVTYAYRHRADYDLVWWVPAQEPAGVLAALADLAERAGVSVSGNAATSARAAVDVLGAGTRFPRWLVVLDNADEPADVQGLLSAAARATHGNLIITTRDLDWSRRANLVDVRELPRDDGVALLRGRAARLADTDAARIGTALGWLPLALDQAGTYLSRTSIPVDDYLGHLDHRVREVMSRNAPAEHPSVTATFTETLETLETADDPAAVMLIRLWAQFAPEPIPIGLIHPGVADALPPPLDTVARDPLALRDLVGRLVGAAMVRGVEDDRVVMHRLARAVFLAATPPDLHPVLRDSAHRLLAAAHPDQRTTPAGWRGYARLYPHAVATDLVRSGSAASRELVFWLIWALRAAGNYPDSQHLAEQAHEHWIGLLGEGHLDAVLAAANLAATYWAQARPEAALRVLPLRRMHDEDLVTRVRAAHGDDHPRTITLAAHLAAALWAQGDHAAARPAFETVLDCARRVLGDDHPHTVRAAAHLAATLRGLGDHTSAQPLLEDVATRARRVLGDDHPDTIRAAVNLAATRQALGDGAARAMCLALLPQARRILGDDHPDTHSLRSILGTASTRAELPASTSPHPATP